MASFKYHNFNIFKVEEEDCVCRALAKALKLEYEVAENLLEMSAKHNNCDALCVCCYSFLLEDVFKLPVKYPEQIIRVNDVVDDYSNNTLLIRIDGHLTMAENGCVFDLWDCRQRIVDKFWIVS
jgi:hypothetical protein